MYCSYTSLHPLHPHMFSSPPHKQKFESFSIFIIDSLEVRRGIFVEFLFFLGREKKKERELKKLNHVEKCRSAFRKSTYLRMLRFRSFYRTHYVFTTDGGSFGTV